jgi:hypothetical protein
MRVKMLSTIFGAAIAGCFLVSNLAGQKAAPTKPKLAVSIKPQHVADALRAVIISHREVYSQAVEGQKVPLSPCEMLRQSSEAVASKGVEFAYVLRALQPLNKRNAPETETEIKGLQEVAKNPDNPYMTEELLGGRWYFTAIYADVASSSCVQCHNARQQRTKYKVGDVVGGLVIRVALEL